MSTRVRAALARLHEADVTVYRSVARSSVPLLDEPLRRLSVAANHSRLSFTAAAALVALGGPRGRRAATTGLLSVGVASTTTNVAVKLLARRRRPAREAHGVDGARWVPMPTSTSFPSGHSAAAFAFASGVGHEWPVAGVPLYALAAAVAYSRVHTGVHYPGDVLAGSALGLAAGSVVSRVRAARRRAASLSRTPRVGRAGARPARGTAPRR